MPPVAVLSDANSGFVGRAAHVEGVLGVEPSLIEISGPVVSALVEAKGSPVEKSLIGASAAAMVGEEEDTEKKEYEEKGEQDGQKAGVAAPVRIIDEPRVEDRLASISPEAEVRDFAVPASFGSFSESEGYYNEVELPEPPGAIPPSPAQSNDECELPVQPDLPSSGGAKAKYVEVDEGFLSGTVADSLNDYRQN
jgi:hypothetical protein